tara:strand:+ start:396 stop:818 length:423 start_codon:yes stop_codon:yes gene_type:complete
MPKEIKDRKHAKTAWKARSHIHEKPWGREIVWAGHDSIHGKILYISAGARTSLKYHKLKAETLFFVSGKAKVSFGAEGTFVDPVAWPMQEKEFRSGDTLMVQSGCPYRIHAIEDCEVIEIGNHLGDTAIRIDDDYGRTKK